MRQIRGLVVRSSLGERGEERGTHHRDGLLEGHFKTVVEGLRADDTVLLCVHDKAAQAGIGRVACIVLW